MLKVLDIDLESKCKPQKFTSIHLVSEVWCYDLSYPIGGTKLPPKSILLLQEYLFTFIHGGRTEIR